MEYYLYAGSEGIVVWFDRHSTETGVGNENKNSVIKKIAAEVTHKFRSRQS